MKTKSDDSSIGFWAQLIMANIMFAALLDDFWITILAVFYVVLAVSKLTRDGKNED